MEKKKTSYEKHTMAAKQAGAFNKKMYGRALEAVLSGQPVAWCMGSASGVPETLLPTAGLATIYPENYATFCAAKRMQMAYIERSEADGFSSNLCGYCRNGLGFSRTVAEAGGIIPPDAPGGGMAKPTVLVGTGYLCEAHVKWFEAVQRYLEVPYFCLDMPFPKVGMDLDAVAPYYIKYLAGELRLLAEFLEKHTGNKMDIDKLCEAVAIGEETRRIWHECYELRKAVPCPMSGGDMMACMIPGYWMPSEKESTDFYRMLYDELKGLVENKIGVVPEEKYRLQGSVWGGWFRTDMENWAESLGAVSCMEAYFYEPGPPPKTPEGVTDPYERLAWQFFFWVTRPQRGAGVAEEWRSQQELEYIRDYKLAGAILPGLTSCRHATLGQLHRQEVFMKYGRIPSLYMEVDIMDERTFNEAKIKADVLAFLETVDYWKEVRKTEGLDY